MTRTSSKLIAGLLLSALLSAVAAHPAFAAAVNITVGKPSNTGTSTWNFVINGVVRTVTINVLGTDSAEQKADKLYAAMRDKGMIGTRDGATVETFNVSTALRLQDNTLETDLFLIQRPKVAVVDFHTFSPGVLAGTDQNGGESQFQSSFGFNGIVADSNLLFSELSGNTIDDLLADTYNSFLADLPANVLSNLVLDLANDEITFAFPDLATNGFVQNFTSDTNAYASQGLTGTIPEPSTLSLALLALLTVSFRLAKGKRRG